MSNAPSPTGVRAGGVSDPPIRRSPRLENRSLLGSNNGDELVAPAIGGGAAPGRGAGRAAPAGRAAGRAAPAGRGAGRAAPGRGAGRAAPGRGGAPPPAGRARGSGPRFLPTELQHLNEAILFYLPLGPEEWERVTEMHHEKYPHFNRCSNSLKRKFKEMYSQTVPTGDPECPEHIRTAKRIHRQILERSDADNLEGPEADLGVEEEGNEGNDEEGVQGVQEGVGGTARQLFPGQTVARPLVRTPGSGRSRSNNGGVSDLTAVVLASLASTNRNEEAEREERRQERRMNQMFMIGILSAMNPAAAAAMQPIQNQLIQQMQNNVMRQEDDDNSSSNN
jgi:hypothetical protein